MAGGFYSTLTAGPWKWQGIPTQAVSILIHFGFSYPVCHTPTCT